jgi:hypothetical protein
MLARLISLPFKGVRAGFRRALLAADRTTAPPGAGYRAGVGMGGLHVACKKPIPILSFPLKGKEPTNLHPLMHLGNFGRIRISALTIDSFKSAPLH